MPVNVTWDQRTGNVRLILTQKGMIEQNITIFPQSLKDVVEALEIERSHAHAPH